MKFHQVEITLFFLCNCALLVHSHKVRSVNCGRRLVNHEPLIVDGSESQEGFWPWHASILHIDLNVNINYKCGGTLLNSNTVLTAAHCVYENGQPIVPYRVLIQLGRNNLKIAGPNSKEVEPFQIIPHPHFNSSSLKNDIAIVLLATEVTFNEYIQPICLWSENKIDLSEVEGKLGTVVGFGVTRTDQISYTLQEAMMPVVSLGTCLSSNNEFYGQFLSDLTFCAGSRNGTTACNGDSGGGIVFEDHGIYRIRGIVSLTQVRPGERRELCKVDEYVVFTDVAKYLSWIEENVPALPPTSVLKKQVTVSSRTPETITWNGNWAQGCEFKGNDLKSVTSPGEECGGHCASTPQCTHFTWKQGTCWMKQNAVLKSDAIENKDKSVVCGVATDEAISWNVNWAQGCEFKGNDLKSVTSPGEECGGLCANTPQCTHFTWKEGKCWMKRNAVVKSDALVNPNKGVVCGVVITEAISWNGNWAENCEFKGNDLKSVESMGEECSGLCANTPQCTHFTWKYGTCWMKQNAVLKSDALVSTNEGVVCGVVNAEAIYWNGNWALGCEFKGNDLKTVTSRGEECGGLCANTPQCTHFTWKQGTCCMKKYNGISKGDAVRVGDTSVTCGVVTTI